MPVYVAMLRRINVAGHKMVKMEDLRASFERLGFRRVRTFVQSGNVIFEATGGSSNSLLKTIGQKLSSDFGFSIPVVLRSSDELRKIVSENLFPKERGIDHSKLHVTFLSTIPTKAALVKLNGLNAHPDQFHINRREIYLHCPNGYGRTKLSNTAFEKLLSVEATTRNWNTVNKLAEMSTE